VSKDVTNITRRDPYYVKRLGVFEVLRGVFGGLRVGGDRILEVNA
jgi:hypothetical protein